MEREKTINSLKSTQTDSHIFFLLLCCWYLIEWQMTFLRSMPRRDFFFGESNPVSPSRQQNGISIIQYVRRNKIPIEFSHHFSRKNVSAAAATLRTWDDIWCCRLSDKQKSQPGHIVIFSFFFSKGAFEVLFFFFCFCCCHSAWLPPPPPPPLVIPETLNTHTPRLGIKGLLAESEAQSLEQKRAPKNNISKLW